MTPFQQLDSEVKNSTPEPKILDAELCLNLANQDYTYGWTKHKLVSGGEKKFIADCKLAKCKKREATALLTIGEKAPSGNFIFGKTKNIYLK